MVWGVSVKVEDFFVMSAVAATAPTPVRRALRSDEDVVVHVLTDGLADDPLSVWMMPDADRRRRLLPALLRVTVRDALESGEVYLAGQGLGAVLVASLSGGPAEADIVEASGECSERVLHAFRLMGERHPSEPCLYVPLIATRTGYQGRGIGAMLLGRVLGGSAPVYLEATTRESLRFYRRHGFASLGGELRLPSGPALFPVLYRPRV